jgi:hypothetical protein
VNSGSGYRCPMTTTFVPVPGDRLQVVDAGFLAPLPRWW